MRKKGKVPFHLFFPRYTDVLPTQAPDVDNEEDPDTTHRDPLADAVAAGITFRETDNAEIFKDRQMGGLALALEHGAVLFECAKKELHATTALKNPDRRRPTRLGIVFYQHR